MLFVQIILPVFLIVLAGFSLEKAAALDFRTLTYSSLYLFTPCLVFSALIKRGAGFEIGGRLTLFMLLYTAALLVISILAGRLLRLEREARGALHLSTVFMNCGNFGLPLAWFAFGQAGLDISILTFVLFNIPLSTLAIVIAQGSEARFSEAVANMLKIPIFHAVVLAFLLKTAGLALPEFLLRAIDLLGQASIPVMLVLLGMQLARTRLQRGAGFLALSSALRLAVAPLVALALAWLLEIKGVARNVVVLQTSTPAAVLPLLYSLRFGTRPDLVAGAVFLTTLLSALSLTVLLYFLQ